MPSYSSIDMIGNRLEIILRQDVDTDMKLEILSKMIHKMKTSMSNE